MAVGVCAELESLLRELNFRDERIDLMARIDALKGVEDCVRDGLVDSVESEDWSRFELYVLAATRHPSRTMTPVLTNVLMSRSDQVNVEDIVEALDAIRDPSSVGVLVETALWEPEWDEFRHLARKCIWALGAIGSYEAVRALREFAAVGTQEVREVARDELNRLAAARENG